MIFQASINTRMQKVKTFFEENMMTVPEALDKLETSMAALPAERHAARPCVQHA